MSLEQVNPASLTDDAQQAKAAIDGFATTFEKMRTEIAKFMVGQQEAIENVLTL